MSKPKCKDNMTQEEKDLLFKDLSARLLYGVMVSVQGGEFDSYKYPYQLTAVSKFGFDCLCKVYHPIYTPFGIPKIEDVKPYLRPMSSMTEEEKEDLKQEHIKDEKIYAECIIKAANGDSSMRGKAIPHFAADWCNKYQFDYRGLIPKGLALEAKEGMYIIKTKK